MKKRLIFIHPFLFALYPVCFLYAQNIHEYIENTIVVPSIIALLFAGFVFFIAKVFVKKIEQAAIIASFCIISALSYSRLLETTNNAFNYLITSNTFKEALLSFVTIFWFQEFMTSDIGQEILTVLMVVGLVGVIFIVFRYTKYLYTLNKLLTIISGVLLFLSFLTIVSFEVQTGRIFSSPTSEAPPIVSKKVVSKNMPDIYYFIFDRYAGPQSLKEQYNFDNTTFWNFLKNKGFYLAQHAKTNYPKTFLSLGSSLNMGYLDSLTAKTHGGASSDESLVTPLIRKGKVLQFLKDKGYYLVNIGPKTWTPTSKNEYADQNFVMEKGTYFGADIFTTGFLNTTIAAPFLQGMNHSTIDLSANAENNEHRKLALYEIGAVEKAIAIQGPKFVFVHILLPHDPFVFDKNCNPINEVTVNKKNHIQNYLSQLQCANKKMTILISDILQKSKTPPVIILQSDEGPFPMKEPVSFDQAWGKASDTALREKFPILDAYYFPNASTAALYDSITPVNSFRVLFNTYFGTDYKLLPDKNYIFQDQRNYYKFTDVTERVK